MDFAREGEARRCDMVLMESAQKLKAGEPAPEFSLMGADGKTYKLFQFENATAVVVIFMCNHCPYVLAKVEAMKKLYERYRPRNVAFIAINSNNNPQYPDDDYEHMKKFVAEHGIKFPYLFDETQAVAKAYGATCTPDPFVFDSGMRLAYHGRIDDAMSPEAKPTTEDLANALDDILMGKIVKGAFKPSRGCSIKWRE
ncbi:Thiol-disulfide oxidoreductase ResA [uncultured archaeon]|nr:Thiol-disulfide oxidoreductase ResA [uncultured archaeon]